MVGLDAREMGAVFIQYYLEQSHTVTPIHKAVCWLAIIRLQCATSNSGVLGNHGAETMKHAVRKCTKGNLPVLLEMLNAWLLRPVKSDGYN